MWDVDVPRARKAKKEVVVIPQTKLSIKKIGKGTYRMQVNKGGTTLLEAKGSNAQLACILGEKRYLPRELGSKSGFTYIDEVEDSGGSGVVDIYRRYVAPKNLGTPIPFKAEVRSEQPASLDDDVEQITGLEDYLEGKVGAGTVAAKAKTAPEMVYEVTLRYLDADYNEVMESVDTIASNLPSQGVTVAKKSVYGAGREGYLKVKTQHDEEVVKGIIWGICSGKRLSDYETPAEIDLKRVEPVPADKPLVIDADGRKLQQTYTVDLEFVESSTVHERKVATKRITAALSNSKLTVGNIYEGLRNREFTVTGQIEMDALEKLLNENRIGLTRYTTPTVSIK